MVTKTGANHLRSLFTGAYRRLVPSIGANESGLQKVQSSDYRSPEAGISAITKANLRWTYAVVLAFAVRKKGLIHFFTLLLPVTGMNWYLITVTNYCDLKARLECITRIGKY